MRFPRSVYAIQHNATKKIYIGSSHNVENRYKNHLSLLRNKKHPVEDMQDDFEEYGEDYSVYILDEINSFEDRGKEYEWMKKYKTCDRGVGYNYKDKERRISHEINVVPFKTGLPQMKEG